MLQALSKVTNQAVQTRVCLPRRLLTAEKNTLKFESGAGKQRLKVGSGGSQLANPRARCYCHAYMISYIMASLGTLGTPTGFLLSVYHQRRLEKLCTLRFQQTTAQETN